ncbi:MAG: MFS transporter [Lentisphaeria bacterium]|nr:MFS transporter [Lentisphaeria bacterium]
MGAITMNLPPRKAQRCMNHLIVSVVIWCFYGAFASGAVFAGLLDALNMTDPQIGLVMSMGQLCLPLQFIGAMIQQRFFRRRRFWCIFVVIHYTSFLLLALLTVLWTDLPMTLAVALFMLIYAISQGGAHLVGSIANAWIGEVVPERDRASFWNRRQGYALIANIAAGLLAGFLVDMLGKDNRMTYAILIVPAVFCGYASMYGQLLLPDRDTRDDWQGNIISQIKNVFANRQFRLLTGFFLVQHVAICCCSGFYNVYLLKDMNLSMTTMQILAVCGALVGLLAAFFFRIVGQHCGNKPVLTVCTFMKIIEFTLCTFWWPDIVWMDRYGNHLLMRICALTGLPEITMEPGFFTVLPSFLVAGFFNVGIVSAQMALLTSTGPKRMRSVSIGIFYLLLGGFGFLFTGASGWVYLWLREWAWLQSTPLQPFNVLTACTVAGLIVSLLIFRRFRENGATGTGAVVKMMISGNPIRNVYQAHVLGLPIGELSRVKKLRHLHTDLISNELVQGLHSPSSRVRDSALLNVSTLEGAVPDEVTDELIRLVDIPEIGMQAMAARTLGRLRIQRSLPVLMAHFRDPDLAISQACIFAAGLIGDVSVEAPLRQILQDVRCQPRWPHAAEALSRLGTGDFRYTRDIFRIMGCEGYWVLRQQTLISLSRLMMRDKNQAYVVFDSESRLPGTEVERLLKALSGHTVWPWLPEKRREIFEQWISRYDAGDFIGCMEMILPEMLRLYDVVPGDNPGTTVEFLSRLFGHGGMRDQRLEANTYAASNLWLQLKLWAELKYETDGTDRFLLLTQLIAALELLHHRQNSDGDLTRQTEVSVENTIIP